MKKFLVIFPLLLFAAACGQDAQIVQGPQGVPGPTGSQGDQGEQGDPGPVASPNPYDIVGEIVPCGRKYADDEVILVLASGKLLMSYTDHGRIRLIEVGPGKYVTTDRKRCCFTVHEDGTVTW